MAQLIHIKGSHDHQSVTTTLESWMNDAVLPAQTRYVFFQNFCVYTHNLILLDLKYVSNKFCVEISFRLRINLILTE
jgi:hypothetical protein